MNASLRVVAVTRSLPSVFGIEPINLEIIAEQQQIADVFYRLQLIPKQIDVKEAVWSTK